jgi:hypothetical protein
VNRQIRDPAIGDSLSVHPHSHLLPDPGRRRQCDQGRQRTAQCLSEADLTPCMYFDPLYPYQPCEGSVDQNALKQRLSNRVSGRTVSQNP